MKSARKTQAIRKKGVLATAPAFAAGEPPGWAAAAAFKCVILLR
jgi:hypothetical protein